MAQSKKKVSGTKGGAKRTQQANLKTDDVISQSGAASDQGAIETDPALAKAHEVTDEQRRQEAVDRGQKSEEAHDEQATELAAESDEEKDEVDHQDDQIAEELLRVLTDLVDNGHWDASLFLRVSKKRLVALRDEVKSLLGDLHADAKAPEQTKVPEKDQIIVYISLHMGGSAPTQARWESMLATLSAYAVGRPVYHEEAHAMEALSNKGLSERDGYAEIIVNQSAVLDLAEAEQRRDRLGHPLLTLRVGAIHSENIVKWVCNGQTYRLIRGRLVLQSED